MEPSFTIFDMKLSIKYAYGREIYLLEQQEWFYNEICLKDEQTAIETMVYENSVVFILNLGYEEIEGHGQKTTVLKSEHDFCMTQDLVHERKKEENASFGEDLNLMEMEDNSRAEAEKLLGSTKKLLQILDLEGSRGF